MNSTQNGLISGTRSGIVAGLIGSSLRQCINHLAGIPHGSIVIIIQSKGLYIVSKSHCLTEFAKGKSIAGRSFCLIVHGVCCTPQISNLSGNQPSVFIVRVSVSYLVFCI